MTLNNFLHKINPFHKFLFVVAFSTIFTFIHDLRLNLWVFALSMILLAFGTTKKQFIKGMKFLIPVTIVGVSLFMTGALWGSDASGQFGQITFESTQNGLNMSTRVFAFAGLGLLFSLTTDSHELIKSLQKDAKLPRKFAYGMLCAVHLLPYMKQEYQNARLAFLVRGVNIGIFSWRPLFAMLVNCFRWSETLSIAMFSKGFYEE